MLYLYFFIYIFSKYAWVAPLKDEKGASIVDTFQKVLDDSNKAKHRQAEDKGRRTKDANQTKYGLIKEVNFRIVLLKNG